MSLGGGFGVVRYQNRAHGGVLHVPGYAPLPWSAAHYDTSKLPIVFEGAGSFTTSWSKDSAEAHTNVLKLYRRVMRSLPHIFAQYELLEIPIEEAKENIKRRFHNYSNVTDPRVIDLLRFKGEQQIGEAEAMFKTKWHLISLIETPKRNITDVDPLRKTQSPFLQEFFRK